MPFLYHLAWNNTLSIKQLRHALQLILKKHQSLRTSLIFDDNKNILMQQVMNQEENEKHLFPITQSTFDTDEQPKDIMYEEKRNPQLFGLAEGLVFRCHILHYKEISSNDILSDKDALIFNFHHAMFDFPSMKMFLHDLNQAYTTGQLSYDDNTTLRYLDCKYKYFSYIPFITHCLCFLLRC